MVVLAEGCGEAFELAGVRGEDGWCAEVEEWFSDSCERVDCVGVDDDWYGFLLDGVECERFYGAVVVG